MHPSSPQSMGECLFWFGKSVLRYALKLIKAKTQDTMWFPERTAHIYAISYVLMLHIFMRTRVLLEHNRARWEQILQSYSNALSYLRLSFRCPDCSTNFERIGDTNSDIYNSVCQACPRLEEGEIIEFPWGLL
ncbi:hypothetical protein F5Y19DRAFT_453539 [Xylariaceae sp. FL1651]|nr:hypothetical protein F5Y19DRAFT_453539 [Xylariaceae sp. FL1651]